MDQKEIIVAIDFGSSRTGYAFSIPNKDKKENKEIKIHLCKFECERNKGKTINEVILDDSESLIQYGSKVKEYIKNGNLKPNEHIYERIKMNLYEEKYTIKAINSLKNISLVNLISKILEYVKEHAIRTIINMGDNGIQNEYDYNKETKKIRWVLTVPAIWDEKNKYIMMLAAENAGILNDAHRNLFFALEPESASYYCLNENPVNKDIFNDPYIICDLGAGTGDIICHQRVANDKIEKIIEKTTPKGGPFGSDEIDKQFENKVLFSLFGSDAMSLIQEEFKKSLSGEGDKNFPSKYIKLKREINEFKESLIEECKGQYCDIDCSIFFQTQKNLNIENSVKKYNEKCTNECKMDWIITEFGHHKYDKNIRFPYKIIYDFTIEIAEKVTNILLDIITEVEDVATIFYVGGFCNSEFIVKTIRRNIQSKCPKIKHIISPEPENSIVMGAVLYGLSPERIKSRKSKYTLGTQALLFWEDKYKDGGVKIYDEKENIYRCYNSFYNFISINDDIPYDNCVQRPLKMIQINEGYLGGAIILYKSQKHDPVFIDEDGVDEIGKFQLEVPKDKAKIGQLFFVTMEMGGTFLNVSAFHKESNTRVNMEFKY